MPDAPHPPEPQLIAFAIGDAHSADRGVIANHLRGCEACREIVSAIEEAQGQILNSLEGAPLSSDALQWALDQIDTADAAPSASKRCPPEATTRQSNKAV